MSLMLALNVVDIVVFVFVKAFDTWVVPLAVFSNIWHDAFVLKTCFTPPP